MAGYVKFLLGYLFESGEMPASEQETRLQLMGRQTQAGCLKLARLLLASEPRFGQNQSAAQEAGQPQPQSSGETRLLHAMRSFQEFESTLRRLTNDSLASLLVSYNLSSDTSVNTQPFHADQAATGQQLHKQQLNQNQHQNQQVASVASVGLNLLQPSPSLQSEPPANGSATSGALIECFNQLQLIDYYAGYDKLIGLRIASTLSILFVVFILFVIYKTGCSEQGPRSRSQLQLCSSSGSARRRARRVRAQRAAHEPEPEPGPEVELELECELELEVGARRLASVVSRSTSGGLIQGQQPGGHQSRAPRAIGQR